MNFGCSYGPKDINCPNCAICDVPVQLGEKLVVDRKTIHIACFKCAICGSKLRVGECALDEALARYGPVWFCHFHHMVPPKEKEEQMLKNGHYKWRAKK